MDITFCVVSHTHWDREWYMPFEVLRMRLVDLMDNLLEVLEGYPDYIFHLDAQTIVLEDYLAIRPHQKVALERHIGKGNLLVGPWYVQNDFYLTSGEATIRNLIVGSRMADEAGKCSWVGYAPDQFGLISQLPQILNGFGIDNCIFGRGYHFFDREDGTLKSRRTRSEFTWKGQDGSEVLAVNMPFWYNNAQRLPEDTGRTMELLDRVERGFEGVAMTPYLLLMNGVDHLEAQENLLPILEKANQRLPETKEIRQLSMQEYISSVEAYIAANPSIRANLLSYEGELRNGSDYEILQGTLSSRVYLKALNVKAQNLLESNIEPLCSFIHATGAASSRYPSDYMSYLWKLLIQNHPHDSICGCSRDEVHVDMESRFKHIAENGEELLKRSMGFISSHVTRDGTEKGDSLVTLFNTLEGARSGVVELELQFPTEERIESFRIADADGLDVPYAVLAMRRETKRLYSPINLPGSLELDSYVVQVYVDKLDGLGYRTLVVKPSHGASPSTAEKRGTAGEHVMENECLWVHLGADGTVDLRCKGTGRLYRDILRLEDRADCGDSYVYAAYAGDAGISSEGATPEITCVRDNGLETLYSLVYSMSLPEGFDSVSGRRSTACVENRVELLIGLRRGCDWLDVGFNIDNRSGDHRLRAVFNTGMSSDYTDASVPFDVIRRDRRDVLAGVRDGTQPNSGFVNIDGEGEGIALLNEGLFEYEHLLGEDGAVALTLVRANAHIFKGSDGKAPDPTWAVPGNQCIRNIRLKAAIYPHAGDYIDANVALRAREFQNPMLGHCQPVGGRLSGDRLATQGPATEEVFYRDDPFVSLVLPMEQRFFGMTGRGVVLSALKKAEKGGGLIVRVYNTTGAESAFEWSCARPIARAYKVDMKEDTLGELPTDGTIVRAVLRPKEIFTFRID